MIIFKWWRLIIGLMLLVVGAFLSINILQKSYERPDRVLSRQIINNTLPLHELWRRKNAWLGPVAINIATIALANQQSSSYQYDLQVLDLETGNLIWNIEFPANVGIKSLLINNDRLYTAITWEIRAYELSDGNLLWQVQGEPIGHTSYKLEWATEGIVNYATLSGEDYYLKSVYDPATGILITQEKVPTNQPFLFNDKMIYEGQCGVLSATDRDTGALKWQTKLKGCPRTPLLVGSDLLVATQVFGGISGLYSINSTNGKLNWYALENDLVSNIVVIDEIVYGIQSDGDIIGLALDTGQEIGRIEFNASQTTPSRYFYTLYNIDQKLIAIYPDSRELIVFRQD